MASTTEREPKVLDLKYNASPVWMIFGLGAAELDRLRVVKLGLEVSGATHG